MAHLIRGRFYLFYAWAARGSDFANKVNPDAWPLFEERLKLAEKDLQRAISLNTLSPEPWVYLVHVYRGLSYSVKEDEAFGKVKERDNYYYKAYFLRLTSLMPKWGGDVEGMFTFARESYKEHASDPIFGLLILEAHDEMASINRRLTKGVKQSDYYKVPEHFQEMRDIVDLILKEHPQSNHARNWSAKIDYLGDKYEEALKQLVDLGDLIDEDVWSKQYVENIKKRLLRQHLRADPEGMLNSARKSYKEHPDDPIFGFLVLEAHDEMSRIAKKLIKDGNKSDYYKVPEHFQEMRSIVDRILKEHPQSTTAKNWSAKIDYLGNRHAEALKQLVELGDLIDEEVWVKEYVERAKKWLMYQYEKGKL